MTNLNEQESRPEVEPWIQLAELIDQGDDDRIDEFLESIPPSETARALSRLESEQRQKLLSLLDPEETVELFNDLPDEQVAHIIESLDPREAALIVDEMPGDDQADILADLGVANAEAILQAMPKEDAQIARELLQYEEDTAGGLMIVDYLAYPEDMTVAEVLEDLDVNSEKYTDYHVQYAYVTTADNKLKGVLRMRDIPLAGRGRNIGSVMVDSPLSVSVHTPLDELIGLFEESEFIGIPVTEDDGGLVGVVQRDDVMEAAGERDRDSYLKASGIVGGDELRSMPLWQRARRRLSWLTINILLNIISASVIAVYQDTLSSVIALAVFLPIISDMSGCSGNQAIAVSIRELTIGMVKPYEVIRVLGKEIGIGIINGIVLGALLGMVAFLWKGNPWLGLVVGGALAVNTVVAVCLGGSIPLILKWRNRDPALASGPILTTVTDMCGFFFALGFATVALKLLVD